MQMGGIHTHQKGIRSSMFVHCTYTRFSNDRLELGEESTQFSFITRILYKMFMYFR